MCHKGWLGVGMVTSKNILGINVLLFCYEEKSGSIYSESSHQLKQVELFLARKYVMAPDLRHTGRMKSLKNDANNNEFNVRGVGQIIVTSHDRFPPNGGLVKVSSRGPARGGPALADASRGLCAMGCLLWQHRACDSFALHFAMDGHRCLGIYSTHLGRNQYSSSGVPHRGSNLHSVRKIATFLNAPFFWLSGPGCSSSVLTHPFLQKNRAGKNLFFSGSSCCLIGLAFSFGDNLTRFIIVRNLSCGNRFFNIYNLSMDQHENNLWITSWWLKQPIWNICGNLNGFIFPQFSGWKWQIIETTTQIINTYLQILYVIYSKNH